MNQEFMKNISIISRCATLYSSHRLADTGLRGCHSIYVSTICTHPGITQEQLAGKLHVNRSSVTRQLTLLEKGGFISRLRSPSDRRTIEVYPTEKMEALLPTIHTIRTDWRMALTEHMPKEELDALEALLSALAKRAEHIV